MAQDSGQLVPPPQAAPADAISLVVLPGFVMALAVGLLSWHVRCWRQARRRPEPPDELRFLWLQTRRRIQAAAMLAVVGAAMVVGQLIPPRQWPGLFVWFWCGISLLVVWVGVLAMADMVASMRRVDALKRDRRVARAVLEAELSRTNASAPANPPRQAASGADRDRVD